MTDLSYGQLEGLWITEGGDPNDAQEAAAVAEAESSGNPLAQNKNTDGSIDRGLWQINSIHGKLSTFDEAQNTMAAIKISSNGSNWHPWATFNTGAYKKYLTNVAPDYNLSVPANPNAQGDTTPAGKLDKIVDPFSWLTSAFGTDIKDLLERFALILFGGILVFIGVHGMLGKGIGAGASKAVGSGKAKN